MKRQLTGDEIKKIELDILLEFSKFCKENDLRFYLAYGTLLGAVRHKGFIPWDDDIDVIMPRPDYEKFIKIYKPSKEKYLLRSNRLKNFSAPFTKLVDINTIVDNQITDETNDIDKNLWIDIFPVDGLPDDVEHVKCIYSKVKLYIRIIFCTYMLLGKGRTVFRKYAKYVIKFLSRMYGKDRAVNAIEKIATDFKYYDSKYVGMIVWLSGGVKEKMLKTDFEQSTEVEFEGHKFPAVACWDRYLTNIYGDYMQLPPVDQRRTHNMFAYKIED